MSLIVGVPICCMVSRSSARRISRTLSSPSWPKADSPQIYGRPYRPRARRKSLINIRATDAAVEEHWHAASHGFATSGKQSIVARNFAARPHGSRDETVDAVLNRELRIFRAVDALEHDFISSISGDRRSLQIIRRVVASFRPSYII